MMFNYQTCFLTVLPFTLPNKSLLVIFAGIGVVRLVLELVYVFFMEAYKNKKYLPLDLRPTKTRAIRRRLTKHQDWRALSYELEGKVIWRLYEVLRRQSRKQGMVVWQLLCTRNFGVQHQLLIDGEFKVL
ncbi:60S ribosomal protein L35 [Artemisia annua]|uniref:60S ribosomal protein L35 n=1 Tax=Artemisia annua TaxID=35608 RepID=A0A2U1NHG9_ARTAN|nr:60S ribosomal protein L35 [Artemisia annua]